MKRKLLIIIAICIFVIILGAFAGSAVLNRDKVFMMLSGQTPTPEATEEPTPTPTAAPTLEPTPEPTATPEPMPQYTTIVIGFAGDMIAHERLIHNGFTYDMGTRTIDYNHIFKYITPALQYPDFMIANLESPIAGEDMQFTQPNTLTFNFPDEIADAIINSGIDMVLNGNNHLSDKNPEGMYRTLDYLDSVGLMHTGAWRTDEERAIPTVVEIGGIKVGIVNPTYSLNGREKYIKGDILDHLACFIDPKQVEVEIEKCKQYGAEIIIVTPHMGDEYEQYTREGIRDYGKAYVKLGADLIVAHHPHVLQGSELIEATTADGTQNEAVCFWSIGNFMHNQTTWITRDFAADVRETGIILYVTIQKDNYTGEVSISNLEYLPIWMLRRADLNPRLYAILPAGEDIDIDASPYDEMPLIDMNYKSWNHAWDLALSQVGTEYATPLSDIPIRAEDYEEKEISLVTTPSDNDDETAEGSEG